MRWDVDEVLARTDLPSLLDEVAQPGNSAVRGRRWHCPVPDHQDVHASVTAYTDHRGHERWHCWSGDDGHRGDAVDLARVTQGLATRDAIDWLARRAGMVQGADLPAVHRKKAPPLPRHVPLDHSVHRYVDACERILWGAGGRQVLDWLRGRGFTDELLRANRAGADPGRRRMFRDRGLPFGRTPAAVMPSLDEDGALAYVQARYIEPGEGDKYDNPTRRLGTNPRLAWAIAPHPTSGSDLLVCEGVPDAWTAAQAGLAAVGILGNRAPDEAVASAIARHAAAHGQGIVAVIDADPAGHAWAEKLTTLLDAERAPLRVIEPPAEGLDLNAWSQVDPTWPTAVATQAIDPVSIYVGG